jgi:FkbM family methyltransferase
MNELQKDLNNIKTVELSEFVGKELYIFGYGSFAQDCFSALKKEGLNIKGYIVSQRNSLNKENIFAIDELDLSNSTVLIGVFNREHPYQELIESLEKNNCKFILMPWDIYRPLKKYLGFRYWLEDPQFYTENSDNISKAIELLGDEESKIIFENVIRFRSGLMNEYSLFKSDEFQYFNKFTCNNLSSDDLIYVDGGAYDGDSYLDCIKYQNISEAFLFEPDPNNFKLLLENCSILENKPCLIPLGLSDSYDTFTFSSIGEAGHIDNKGDISIATCALDDFFGNKKINFIKLDIEGNEKKALIGAKNIIKEHTPLICLSAYHRPEDIWELANVINSISEKYSFYLRQHYFNSFDVVLYAIPSI